MSVYEWDDCQDDPWDDDLYWLNQREADDYRDEDGDLYEEEPDNEPFDDFGDYGPGVDDFDHDNTWGVD